MKKRLLFLLGGLLLLCILFFLLFAENNKKCISGDCDNGYGVALYNIRPAFERGVFGYIFPIFGDDKLSDVSESWTIHEGEFQNGVLNGEGLEIDLRRNRGFLYRCNFSNGQRNFQKLKRGWPKEQEIGTYYEFNPILKFIKTESKIGCNISLIPNGAYEIDSVGADIIRKEYKLN